METEVEPQTGGEVEPSTNGEAEPSTSGEVEPPTSGMVVKIAADRLSALLTLSGGRPDPPPTCEQVADLVRESGVHVDDAVEARLEAFLELLGGDKELPDEFLIAEGRAPVDGQDEVFVWDPMYQQHLDEWKSDAKVNYYTLNSILTVNADDRIGSIRPAVPEQPGITVSGKPIDPARSAKCMELDPETVARDAEDHTQVTALVSGHVVCRGNKLLVVEVLRIPGNVCFSSGNIDSSIDVEIKGVVQDKFEVKSARSVTVGGAIEAATVIVRGNVVVGRGILGRRYGRVQAGGNVIAKFCDEADLHAGGDVKLARQAMNSRIHCEGKLLIGSGALVGGCTYAKEGVVVATIGSGADVPTRIAVGVHPYVLLQAAKIDEELKSTRKGIERIRQNVQPLMQDMKRLTAAQREQATELLFKADEAEAIMAERIEQRDRMLAEDAPKSKPSIRVSGTIHPHTTISIDSKEVHFDKLMHGPVSIEKRKVDNVTEFVAVNQLTGSIQVLYSTQSSAEELIKLLGAGLEEREETEDETG